MRDEESVEPEPCPYCGGKTDVGHVHEIPDAIIWRYLDFTKFIDLITSRQLYFSRMDLLGDPFEGSYPQKYVNKEVKKLRAEGKESLVPLWTTYAQEYRRHIFVNCWHMNDHESAALWKLYLKSDEGIAIKSTRYRLAQTLSGAKENIWFVPVRYIDFEKDEPTIASMLTPTALKRKSFEHEKEVRAIAMLEGRGATKNRLGKAPTQHGLKVKIDLNSLLDGVVVAPTAPNWFFDLTKRICEQNRIEAKVTQSTLSERTPVFI